MRLYAVEYKNIGTNAGYYWAENANDAINQHRMQRHTVNELEAYAVWANNSNKAYRGYVVEES